MTSTSTLTTTVDFYHLTGIDLLRAALNDMEECLERSESPENAYKTTCMQQARYAMRQTESLASKSEPPAVHCPYCTDGSLQRVADATETRAVIGYAVESWMYGKEQHSSIVAKLSDADDINILDDSRICCNSCDVEFYRDDIKAIVDGTFDAEVR